MPPYIKIDSSELNGRITPSRRAGPIIMKAANEINLGRRGFNT